MILMMTPCLRPAHQRIEAPRHVDVAEHLQIPGGAPPRLVHLGDRAAGNGARIVDQKIGLWTLGRERVDAAAVGKIEWEAAHRDIVLRGNLGPGGIEIGGGARDQHDIAALSRQNLGAGPADPSRSAGDQRLASPQTKLHPVPLKLLRARATPLPHPSGTSRAVNRSATPSYPAPAGHLWIEPAVRRLFDAVDSATGTRLNCAQSRKALVPISMSLSL